MLKPVLEIGGWKKPTGSTSSTKTPSVVVTIATEQLPASMPNDFFPAKKETAIHIPECLFEDEEGEEWKTPTYESPQWESNILWDIWPHLKSVDPTLN